MSRVEGDQNDDRVTIPTPQRVSSEPEPRPDDLLAGLDGKLEATDASGPVIPSEPQTVRSPMQLDPLSGDIELATLSPRQPAALEPTPAADTAPDSTTPLESRDFIRSEKPPNPPPRRAADSAEEETPTSGTPSLETLSAVARKRESESAKASGGSTALVAEDRRPPTLRIEEAEAPRSDSATPALRIPTTEAPVAGSKPPPARESSNRSSSVAVLVLAAAAAFFGVRLAQTTEDSDSARVDERPITDSPAAASDGLAVTPAVATDSPTVAEPSRAEALPPAPETEPAVEVTPLTRPTRARKDPPNVVATSVTEENTPEPDTAVATEPAPAEVAFDSGAAGNALEEAAGRASSCRKGGDPSGTATVTVTFSSSGRVTAANISGPPFAGTETGSCIASTLRSARVPAFAGDFVTVKKTVIVQ